MYSYIRKHFCWRYRHNNYRRHSWHLPISLLLPRPPPAHARHHGRLGQPGRVPRQEPGADAEVHRVEDRLAREAAAIGTLAPVEEGLRGDHDFIASREILECTADDFLRGAVGVGIGGVEKVDAKVERLADERPAGFFVQGPRMVSAVRHAVGHAAQDKRGDVEAGAAELYVAHGGSPVRTAVKCDPPGRCGK